MILSQVGAANNHNGGVAIWEGREEARGRESHRGWVAT